MSRLKIPVIRNQRRKALKGFERGIAVACGIIRPKYLALERSVFLYDSLNGRVPPEFRSGRVSRAEIENVLRNFQQRCSEGPCFVFLAHHWFMGGIEMQWPTFLSKALGLLDFDGDTVFAVSSDVCDGFMVDFDGDPIEDGGGYELAAWGDRCVPER